MNNKIIILVVLLLSFLTSCSNKKSNEQIGDKITSDTLKLISFNIRYDNPNDGIHQWSNRREACAEMICKYKPDAFGIQEALINQLEDLQSFLPGYSWIGEGRDPETESNEYAAIFFCNDKFKLIQGNTFWLSETPDVVSKGWDARYNRVSTWAHLQNCQSGKEFIFLNTHLDHKGQIARTESTKLIVDKLRTIGGQLTPVFVAGDLNALPTDPLLVPLKEWMKDVRMEVAPGDSTQTTNGWGSEPDYKVIDYIFFREATPLGYKVITESFGVPYISDHYPIEGIFVY